MNATELTSPNSHASRKPRAVARFAAAIAASTLCMAGTASAAMVSLVGDDLTFSFDDSTLFGSNVGVVGNTLVFNPDSFEVHASDGGGSNLLSETIVINVTTNSDSMRITGASLGERGSYLRVGSGTLATATGSIRITSQTTLCDGLACTAAETFQSDNLSTMNALTEWTADATNPMTGWSQDTDVNISLENLLISVATGLSESDLSAGADAVNDLIMSGSVTGDPAEIAYISKQYVGLSVDVAPVPVPAAVYLFGSALGGLGVTSRARRAR